MPRELQIDMEVPRSGEMDLPWAMHFGIKCTCGRMIAIKLETEEQIEACKRDPTEGLRALTEKDRMSCVAFFSEHSDLGHDPEPTIAYLASMPVG